MNSDWQNIADALRQEIGAYGALLNLFDEQQRCIFRRDAAGIHQINVDIETHVGALQAQRREREAAVADFATRCGVAPTSTLRSLLPHFIAEVRPLFEALISEINVLIHRVRRVSRHNQTLLARSLDTQQQLLRTLRPDSFPSTYAPNGRMPAGVVRAAPVFSVAG